MRSETGLVGSVPHVSVCVKSVMRGVLAGLPVASTEFGASLEAQTTSVQFSTACARLLGVQREVIVRARFQLGDLWNQWQSDAFRVERTIWLASLRLRIPDAEKRKKYLRQFNQCGWVASKWSVADRTDKHCWTYWLENPKGEGGRLPKLRRSLRGIERVLRNDGEYIELMMPSEELVECRVTDLPVRDERTKVAE